MSSSVLLPHILNSSSSSSLPDISQNRGGRGVVQQKPANENVTRVNKLAAEKVNKLKEQGFKKPPKLSDTIFRGKPNRKAVFTKNDDLTTAQKVARGFAMVGAAPILFTKKGRQETIDPLFRGKAKETIYFELDDNENVDHLGYDPRSTLSVDEYNARKAAEPELGPPVGAYFKEQYEKRPRNNSMRQIDGVLVLREHRRKDISSVLMISTSDAEKGNWDAARSVKYYYEKSGSSIKNDAESWRAIRKIIVCKDDIDKGLDKIADKMAQEHFEQLKLTTDDDKLPNIDELRKSFRKVLGRKRIVISSRDNTWRAGPDNPNNPRENSSICGSFSKETKKELEVIDRKDMMKHKPPLEGEKPFDDEKDLAVAPPEPPKNILPLNNNNDEDSSNDALI